MKYIAYVLLIAVVFGLVALVDFLLGKLLRRTRTGDGRTVRLPRYSFVLGILLFVVGLMAVLYLQALSALWIGCLVMLLLGAFLLLHFAFFVIDYDDAGFSYRTLVRRRRRFSYGDITGQRAFVARSGVNVLLYCGGVEIALNGAMQGVKPFLETAHRGWCAARGLDPDRSETNPDYLSYFPEV